MASVDDYLSDLSKFGASEGQKALTQGTQALSDLIPKVPGVDVTVDLTGLIPSDGSSPNPSPPSPPTPENPRPSPPVAALHALIPRTAVHKMPAKASFKANLAQASTISAQTGAPPLAIMQRLDAGETPASILSSLQASASSQSTSTDSPGFLASLTPTQKAVGLVAAAVGALFLLK
jgi:hypothetical protein